jgi:signal transduction histidine kinase
MRRGDLDAALAHYTAALATTDDSVTVAKIASNAANVYERLGRLPEALVLYRRALGIVRAARDSASEALVLGNVGAVFTRLARNPGASGTRAASPVRAATAASAAVRAPDRTAADSALGYAWRELALARALRDPSRIARAEDHVGAALAAAGRPAEALAPLARAAVGYTRLGQRAERLANLRVAAEANLALGHQAAAATAARTAVALADSLDAHEERAEALGVLALASAATGEPAAALAAAWAGRAALDAVYATSRAAAAERTRAAFEVARRQWALDQAEARGVALRAEVARQRTLVWFGALGAALATALLVLVLRAARLARQNAVLVAAQGVQAERLRIAREVHDTLLQGFTGVTLQMQVAVEQLVAADASHATLGQTSDAAAAFERVLGRADAVLAEARSAVWDLRTPGAAEPLPAALAALLDDLAPRPTVRPAASVIGGSSACRSGRSALAAPSPSPARLAREPP